MIFSITKPIKQKKSLDGVDIIVDNDAVLQYEKNGFFRSLFNVCLSHCLQLISVSVGDFLIKKSSKKAVIVQKNVTTHIALDVLYTTGVKFKNFYFFDEIAEHIWFNLSNPRAVRNRLKLVKKLLKQSINLKLKEEKKIINIVSLASGSARAIIETVKKFDNKTGVTFNVKLLDRNSKALEISKKIVQKNNISNSSFEFIVDKIRNFPNYCKGIDVDIIEMVGFLDYLDEEKGILVLNKIYDNLTIGGVFITANIRDNNERKFVEKVLRWKMVYRNPNDLSSILLKSGFNAENIVILYEPLLIHGVAIAKK